LLWARIPESVEVNFHLDSIAWKKLSPEMSGVHRRHRWKQKKVRFTKKCITLSLMVADLEPDGKFNLYGSEHLR